MSQNVSHQTVSQKKILVVDDEPDIVEIVRANLESEGYVVVAASGGVEGLQMVRAEGPDLVILDVLMPDLGGWEVLRRIETNPRTAGLPIIMLSSLSDDADVLRGLKGGAVEYVTKPFQLERLVALVTVLLDSFDPQMREERRQRLIARRQRVLDAAAPSVPVQVAAEAESLSTGASAEAPDSQDHPSWDTLVRGRVGLDHE